MADATLQVEAAVPSQVVGVASAAPAGNGAVRRRAARPDWQISAIQALLMFAAAIGCLVVTFLVGAVRTRWSRWLDTIGLGVGTTLFLFGVVRAVIALRRMWRAGDEVPSRWTTLVAVFPLLGGGIMTLLGALLTMLSTTGFTRGRQIRHRGKIVLPKLEAGGNWAQLSVAAAAAPELRAGLATQWRENGKTEHASVAAFAQLTIDLLALGAPPELIAGSNRDSLDEIRHAQLCFSLARALDGKSEGPAPFPEARRRRGGLSRLSDSLELGPSRALALARLAVDSLIDGALHEGVSARVLARLVKRCEDPAVREVLRELAADEGRHSAHGWDVVQWCLTEGNAPVAAALRGALAALPLTIDSNVPAAARDGSWEAFGLHGEALEAEEHQRARADLVRRVNALLAATERQAAA